MASSDTLARATRPAGSPHPTGPLARIRRAAVKVDAATPAHRDRGLDGLRAIATCSVPIGHWLLGGFTVTPDAAIHNASPLGTMGFFAPMTWLLQMLGVFFLVGGRASVLSYERATARGESYRGWLGSRMARLLRPVVAVAAIWAVLLAAGWAAGVPADSLRTGAVLVVQPLWFVGIYAALTALTPLAAALARRAGIGAALGMMGAVAAVDAVRYGPWAEAAPGWLAAINLLPGWMFAYQLGAAWALGGLDRRAARRLLLGGVALFATLLLVFDYPASMVGVPGAERGNAHPPSLLVLALASVQCALAVLLRDRLDRALRRPMLWLPVAMLNLGAMTVFCWHQSAMLAWGIPAGLLGGVLGDVPGLTGAPTDLAWVAARLCWLPVFAGTLLALAAGVRRFEAPWHGIGVAGRALAGLLAAAFATYALLVV
ncbi:acyltransferase family protein [Allostreptomyces psammosilenae]|uniref:Acyltransferase 3 domain-containing protein n=1 Tax=Allostreptomyces psammosilenae TaxID=1892865 RepID=A0A852ZMD2_9ACTN|nr:acyltransferase [Allostreptomyces psammosilenae]NYI03559.1 hypothetical protein [Allostreptomyces psammosilenae]